MDRIRRNLTDLDDCPSSLTGNPGRVLRVNDAADGVAIGTGTQYDYPGLTPADAPTFARLSVAGDDRSRDVVLLGDEVLTPPATNWWESEIDPETGLPRWALPQPVQDLPWTSSCTFVGIVDYTRNDGTGITNKYLKFQLSGHLQYWFIFRKSVRAGQLYRVHIFADNGATESTFNGYAGDALINRAGPIEQYITSTIDGDFHLNIDSLFDYGEIDPENSVWGTYLYMSIKPVLDLSAMPVADFGGIVRLERAYLPVALRPESSTGAYLYSDGGSLVMIPPSIQGVDPVKIYFTGGGATFPGPISAPSISGTVQPQYVDQDATHRFVSDTEKSTWNSKQNALTPGTDYLTPTGSGAGLIGITALQVGAMTNPMTASGDMIYGGTSGAPTRLAKGADGQRLTLVSGLPAWSADTEPDPGTVAHALAEKAAPVDADEILVADSAASYAGKKTLWSSIKSTLKTYFDTVYLGLTGGSVAGTLSFASTGWGNGASNAIIIDRQANIGANQIEFRYYNYTRIKLVSIGTTFQLINSAAATDGGDGAIALLTVSSGAGSTATEKVRISRDGNVGIGTTSPTAKLDINSDILRLRTAKTPASATATGNQGDICWDASYIYICTATNTWVRAALATW